MSCSDFIIILAAGAGLRYGKRKQFELLNGRPLWEYVYGTARSSVDAAQIVVVGVDIEGGATRSQSVCLGLDCIDRAKFSQVAILEAARPLLTIRQLNLLFEHGGPSKTFVKPPVNTIIGLDKKYYERRNMLELLTPQCFDVDLLVKAYSKGKYFDMTDETRVMWEEHSILPEFIYGGENLYKVTFPGDIDLIAHMMKLIE